MEGKLEDTFEKIYSILNSDRFTKGEKEYLKFQMGLSDGFYSNLWEAIADADDKNLTRIAKACPEEVAAFKAFKVGNLRRRFEYAGVSISSFSVARRTRSWRS